MSRLGDREVLECGSPLPLCVRTSTTESGSRLPHSKTLSRARLRLGGSWPPSRSERSRALSWTAVFTVAWSLSAGVVDMSPPLQDVQAGYNGFQMVCQVYDPAQGKVMEDRTAVSSVFEFQNVNGVVAWTSGNAFYLRAYDPSRTNWMATNLVAASAQDLRNHRGTVAWNTGNLVSYHVYDQRSGTFIGQTGPGNTFDLRSVDGVVSWTSGNLVCLRTFDPAAREWQGLNVTSGATFNLLNTNGIVTWSSGDIVRTRVYDPLRRVWATDDAVTGSPLELRNDSGLVAWSNGSVLWTRLFHPGTGQWLGLTQLSPSGMVLALGITNATLGWSDGFNTRLLGYDWYTTNWVAGRTPALPFFAVSTNAGAAPLPVRFTDMSVGAVSFSWDFGDASGTSTLRSPAHTYANLGRYPVTLTVTGFGTNLVARTNILTDLEPPAGEVVINDGATSTTNRNVTLTLTATDNSGLVPRMRLSNTNGVWNEWESFVTNKLWQFPEGVTTRTVYAQFEDPFGNLSAVVSDSIFVDTTPPPAARFQITETNVVEQARTLNFAVNLDHPMSRQVRVDYASRNGTATAGSDYLEASGTLIYPPGTTQQFISIQILDDALVEPNEDFTVELLNPTDVVPGPPLKITMLDNDIATVRLAADRLTVGEGDGAANVGVVLSSASGLEVTVEYAATNLTAIAGLDFVPVTGVLVFAPGQTSKTIQVPLLDDAQDEMTETFLVSLSHATNAALGTPSITTVEIRDNDPPTANFSLPEYWVNEAAGSVQAEVVLTKPYTQTIFVDYRTAGGTAAPGQDYVVASGTLIFSPGQTNRSFPVTLLQDQVLETPKTVGVSLSGFVNVYPGGRVNAQIVIVDASDTGLNPIGFDAQDRFQLEVVGPPGKSLRLETSPDLAAWVELATLPNPSGSVKYTDAQSTGQTPRYYRSSVLP